MTKMIIIPTEHIEQVCKKYSDVHEIAPCMMNEVCYIPFDILLCDAFESVHDLLLSFETVYIPQEVEDELN